MYIQRSEWHLQRTRLSRSLWKRYLHLSVINETYIRIPYGKEEQLDGSYFETGYFIDIKWNRNVVYILTIGDLNELNVPRNHTSSSYSVIHKLLPSNVLEIYTFYFVYHPLYSFSSVTAFNINPVDKACSNWKLAIIHCRQFSIL